MSAREVPERGWPGFDDRVHVWMSDQGCCPGTVDALITDSPTGGNTVALQIKTDERVNDCSHRISPDYDPTMRASGSWHWPDDHQPPKVPSLSIEALARLDLRPDEILAITLGGTPPPGEHLALMSEEITEWLADHGQPVAGVMVLPQGSGLAAIRAPRPVEVNFDFTRPVFTDDQLEQMASDLIKRTRREPPRQH